jgi:hypothetical protein
MTACNCCVDVNLERNCSSEVALDSVYPNGAVVLTALASYAKTVVLNRNLARVGCMLVDNEL